MTTHHLQLPLSLIGRFGPDKIVYGASGQNKLMVWHRDNPSTPHLRISGSTGGGKGGAIRVDLCHELAVGTQVIICAPDPGEFGWTEGAATVATGDDQIAAAINWADQQLHHRLEQLATAPNPNTGTRGVDTFRDLTPQPPRIKLVLDEMASITGNEAPKGLPDRVLPAVGRIAKRGRKVGITLLAVTQNPTIEDLFGGSGAGGGGIKANLRGTVHFDRNATSLHAAFHHCDPISPHVLTALAQNRPGRCAYAFLAPADRGQVKVGQVMWITQSQARRFATNYQGPPPVNPTPARTVEIHP